ncbi:hypothetical protein V1264_017487 [Littorina saxatilis]|uniref:Rho GTPase-activating protein 32 n=1 Tax=Littorina saxatilis TaxID=31220 RepID=A0AAN9GEN1_9CAEN
MAIFQMDNRGNRLLAVDDSGINTPAIAAAHAVKRYNAQAADEISLQVGDIVSVIDMPPAEDTIWWRGKRGFEVGFFPSECVEVIGDKVPASMATCMPATGSLSSSAASSSSATPLSTPATARKPCEIDSPEDEASMMRKHGKLLSFLRTFFSTRPPRNQLKQSGIVKERVFGCDLGEHLLNSGHDVPLVLKSCAEVIERYGIVDGIYRLSGITSNIQKLRVALDEDQVPELMDSTYLQDIHSISSLLKMYFRELPNPLLTYQLYDKFAEAVKDEDNKLLRIHDVVQQLPPPHYRTLEYLMKHLGRVASHALETGMHSKNLAIVWAPNLLRSKELELGGGAAALQGVGIQAVVTECLICYCDLIFNDKMPSYSSQQMQKSQKKPRPKSLAISTPTRLLSLEEARERAFIGSLAHSRFIDVGGGPASLPSTYHTVIDLPGYRKKANKDSNKGKKSPVSGWKSIFSKPRAGSVKKGSRKGSVQDDEKSLGSVQAKALTEEDVHNWKRRLRSAKSAESLLSMTASARSSISSQTSSVSISHTDGYRQREELLSPYHKRSLSSDASTIIHHYHHTSPTLQSLSSPSQPPSDEATPESPASPGSHQSRTDRRSDPERKQSFVRGDSTRKALHRRTPSAPNTPRLDRDRTSGSVNGQQKASSQPRLDSLPGSPHSDSSLLTSPTDTSLGIDIDAAIKARLQQMALQSRNARSSDSSPRSPEKLPPGGGSRGDTEKRKAELGNGVVELQSSPGSHRRHDPTSPVEQAKFFTSRYHDYAEILSDEEGGRLDVSAPSSTTDMQELVHKLDSKLSSATTKFYLRDSEDTSEPEPKHAKLETEKANSQEKAPHANKRLIPATSVSSDSPPPSTQVVRRRTEWIPSESALTAEQAGVDFPELVPRTAGGREAALPPIPHGRHRNAPQPKLLNPSQQGNMTKCLSVPSDIAKSLENITASQNDLLSSVTISELSQSINSFSTGVPDDAPGHREDSRWRRSTSLDSLEAESSLCRTLREINAQMDSAFVETVDRALQMEEEGYHRHGGGSDSSSLTPLYISEDNLATTPTALQETHFPAGKQSPQTSPQETIPRSMSDNTNLDKEGVDVAMSQSYPVPADYAVVVPRRPRSKRDGCSDFEADFPDYAVINKKLTGGDSDSGSGRSQRSNVSGYSEDRVPGRMFYSPQDSPQLERSGSDTQSNRSVGFSEPTVNTPQSSQLGSPSSTGRRGADSRLDDRLPRSDASTPVSNASTSRSYGSAPRSDTGIPRSNSNLEKPSLSGGVCVVKRQRNSSSSDSSSDDSNSDDSIDIVHHAQPHDSQFAMKLSCRQRAAESLPLPSSPPLPHPPLPLQIIETEKSSTSRDNPGDLRQFSPNDVMWRQSPIYDKTKEKGEGRNPSSPSHFTFNPPAGAENMSPKRTDTFGPTSRTFYHPSEAGGESMAYPPGPLSPGASRSHEGRDRVFSEPSERGGVDPSSPRRAHSFSKPEKRPQESAPIVAGNLRGSGSEGLHACTPASQQSHIPSPQSLTISAPSPQSSLVSPRSPTISSHHQSRIPSPRSPTSPSHPPHLSRSISSPQSPSHPSHPSRSFSSPQSPRGGREEVSPNVPLHMMLYHPDEFQIPHAAVGMVTGSGSSSLAQVHVQSDTVTEEKAVIRKVSTGRAVPEKQGSTESSPKLRTWKDYATDSGATHSFSSEGGMQLGKAEQDSMEVDNLCNRLVDNLHNVSSQSSDPDLDPDPPLTRGSVQVEARVERRVEESEIGGEAIVEQRLVRVESFGDVQAEEMENALNVGKEMLLAHTSSSSSSSTNITTTTTVSSSGSSQLHSQSPPARHTHERRPSASKIPRFHKRTNSREGSDCGSQGDVSVSQSPSCGSDNSKSVSGTKSKDSNENCRSSSSEQSKASGNEPGKQTTLRGSKIPLSQKMPSPTSSFREPKTSKSVTSPSSPRPAAVPPSGKSSAQAKPQPSPVPRTRTSIHKSDHVAPPAEEVVEIARPSVKKRTSLNQKGDRNAAAASAKGSKGVIVQEHKMDKGDKGVIVQEHKTDKGDKGVILQEIKMDKGDAKLVIEKQPNLKKKIQTVHARKVPHPPRQIAEALDTDTTDSPPAELSSTGPSDLEHSGMSSQEDEVFSDESLRVGMGVGRDRSYSSGTAGRSARSQRQPRSPLLDQQSYQYLAASRSSLDDSILQLAAERHDDLIPNWEVVGGVGYSTGSLRTRRSLKMRNLMEVFERGGNSSEEGGEVKVREQRSDSTSGSTTISLGSQEKEPDTDDDIFQPPCARLPSPGVSRRSRSRDRGGGGRQPSPHRRPSQSPTVRRASAGRGEDSLRRRRPSPSNRSSTDERPKTTAANRTEGGVGFGRPPRYRSSSRGRTYSDSSTSESDNTQHLESTRGVMDSPSRPCGLPRGRAGRQEDSRGGRQEESKVGRQENKGKDSIGRQEDSRGGRQEESKVGRQENKGKDSIGRQEDSRGGKQEESKVGRQEDKDSVGSHEDGGDGVERRGSIKELRQLFEKSPKDDSKDSGSEMSPTTPVRRSFRTRSVSPAADNCPPPAVVNVMRRSLEIPSSSAMLKQRDTPLTAQPLRLGPKPFYGSKK